MRINLSLVVAVLMLVLLVELLLAIGDISGRYITLASNYTSLSVEYSTLKVNYNELVMKYSLINVNYSKLKGNYTNLVSSYGRLLASYNITVAMYNETLGKYDECLNASNYLRMEVSNYTRIISNLYVNISKSNSIIKALTSNLMLCNRTLEAVTGNYSNKTAILQDYINSLYRNYTILNARYYSLEANYSSLMNTLSQLNNTLLNLNNTVNYLKSGGYIYEYGLRNLHSTCNVTIVGSGGSGLINVTIKPTLNLASQILSYGSEVMLIINIPVYQGNPILVAIGRVKVNGQLINIESNVTVRQVNGSLELIESINIIDSLTVVDTVILPSEPHLIASVTITQYDQSKPLALDILYSLQNQNAVSALCIVNVD
jgi:hypothetical protein